MTPPELLKTVYLGDRGCKGITLDGWNGRVSIHVDEISRVRSESGSWDFYTAEDIPDGRLVFEGAQQIRFDPSGPIPNDFINDLVVSGIEEPSEGKRVYTFTLSIGSGDEAGACTEVIVEIKATDLYLEDPRAPGTQIRD